MTGLRDWITAFILVALIGLALYVLVPAYARHRDSRMTIHELEESLARQEDELRALRKELASLRTDYRAIERVARERFGLCRDGEVIFHFEESSSKAPGATPDADHPVGTDPASPTGTSGNRTSNGSDGSR